MKDSSVLMSGKDWVIFFIDHPFFPLRRKQMAETIYAPDPLAALSAQHSDIRREGSVERGEIRYDIATRSADNRYANAIGQSDIRREQAIGHGDIKYSIAEHAESTNLDVLTTGHQTRQLVFEVQNDN